MSELEILKEPEWTKRELDEIREFIFAIINKIREKKSLVLNDEPVVIFAKTKREETLKTLQQFISYESRDSYPDIDVDGEVFTLKDFGFKGKNIYLIFKKDMKSF